MGISKNSSTVSIATFTSRIFGLIRELLFAALIGAGFFADAFVLAFRIPNLLRDLFAEGALSNAFVPTFTDYEVNRSREAAWKLANTVLGLLLIIMGLLTILGLIFTPQLVNFIAPGFSEIEGKHELTTYLTRIMLPFLPLVAIAALFMGIHNVHGQFTLPALAPVMFNLVSIACGLGLWFAGVDQHLAVIGWSVGTLLGGLSQAGMQLPALIKRGWKIRPTLKKWRIEPGLRQIGILMLPALIANSGTQVNILVNSILASLLDQGSPSWLNYGFRLVQLPIGVFGVAISVVTLATLSKDVSQKSRESFLAHLTSAIHLVLLLTIPCAVGLWILGEPIVRLIYERGAFHAPDTVATAAAVSMYALGLPAYAMIKVKAPVFFALKNSKVPMIASLVGISVNIVFNLLFYQKLRHPGLALGTSIGVFTNLFILLIWFEVCHGGLAIKKMIFHLVKVMGATIPMAFAAYFGHKLLSGILPGIWGKALDTLIPILFAIGIYFMVLLQLAVPEARLAIDRFSALAHRLFSR